MFTTNHGGVPGVTTPIEKAAGASITNGLHTHTNDANFRTDGAIRQAPDGNVIVHQIAVLTLAGHTVHKGGDGDFIVCKYGLTRYCADFAELQAFAVKLGVSHE